MNIKTVKESDVTEFEIFSFCIEASSLGLPVGNYPGVLDTTLGNGQPFIFNYFTKNGTAVYFQECGCIQLHVLND